MAKNEFLPFGIGAGANVLSSADWSTTAARTTGFAAGVAKSRELNTAWRQSSVISSVVAQFIADSSGLDVLDNGDTATLKTRFIAALTAQTTGRLLGIKTFSASGTYTPTAGTKKIRVKMWGGGGAGGGCQAVTTTQSGVGAGGNAGNYSETYIDVVSGSVVVGVGGTGVVNGSGTNGGSTSFAGITVSGGLGGAYGVATGSFPVAANISLNPPPSGAGGNIFNIAGAPATTGLALSAAVAVKSLGGASSIGAGGAGLAAGGNGAASAGSGGSVGAVAGSAGLQGYVIIEEYA